MDTEDNLTDEKNDQYVESNNPIQDDEKSCIEKSNESLNEAPFTRLGAFRRTRDELNQIEKERTRRINSQILALRTLLEDSNVETRKDKFSVLRSTHLYVEKLQNKLANLENMVSKKRLLQRLSTRAIPSSSSSSSSNHPPIDQASQSDFKSYFHNAAIPLLLIDVTGKLISFNSQFSRVSGCTSDVLDGMSIYSLTHPDDIEIMMKSMRTFTVPPQRTTNHFWIRFQFLEKDEDCYVSMALIRRQNRSSPQLIGVQVTSVGKNQLHQSNNKTNTNIIINNSNSNSINNTSNTPRNLCSSAPSWARSLPQPSSTSMSQLQHQLDLEPHLDYHSPSLYPSLNPSFPPFPSTTGLSQFNRSYLMALQQQQQQQQQQSSYDYPSPYPTYPPGYPPSFPLLEKSRGFPLFGDHSMDPASHPYFAALNHGWKRNSSQLYNGGFEGMDGGDGVFAAFPPSYYHYHHQHLQNGDMNPYDRPLSETATTAFEAYKRQRLLDPFERITCSSTSTSSAASNSRRNHTTDHDKGLFPMSSASALSLEGGDRNSMRTGAGVGAGAGVESRGGSAGGTHTSPWDCQEILKHTFSGSHPDGGSSTTNTTGNPVKAPTLDTKRHLH